MVAIRTDSKIYVVPPMSCLRIEAAARNLIRRSYPELLEEPGAFPVDDFFELKLRSVVGYHYAVTELPLGTEGATDPIEKEISISPDTFELMLIGDGRARFTVCHEIGHAVLHHEYLSRQVLNRRGALKLNRTQVPPYQDSEYQANAFSSSLLMPAKHVASILREGGDQSDIVRIFQVSWQAAEVKINKLHLYLR